MIQGHLSNTQFSTTLTDVTQMARRLGCAERTVINYLAAP